MRRREPRSLSHAIGALAEAVSDGKVDIAGVVDATQMKGVYYQWGLTGNAEWKMPLIERVLGGAAVSGKVSTPYGQGSVHDYMHAKVTVADDDVFTVTLAVTHEDGRTAATAESLYISAPASATTLSPGSSSISTNCMSLPTMR